jgi:hypothetical protein
VNATCTSEWIVGHSSKAGRNSVPKTAATGMQEGGRRQFEPLKCSHHVNHLICRVERFEIIAPYTLRIDFDDSTQQIVDFLPVLRGELYGPLEIWRCSIKVALDTKVHTMVWPNGAARDGIKRIRPYLNCYGLTT